jgi:DNA-binding HxlR family transcriptional regulator
MKRYDNKSHCPINYALEVFGDPWTLLIIRDIVYVGKSTFGEFLKSEERIASNVLTNRLAQLEQKGILEKRPHPEDKRKDVYYLTEKGLDLIPLLHEFAKWGAKHGQDTEAPIEWIAMVDDDRERLLGLTRETVQNGGSIFMGSNSVIEKLSRS